MFRIKKVADGTIPDDGEVEIEFIGGSKTKLVGQTAKHFLDAIDSMKKKLSRK